MSNNKNEVLEVKLESQNERMHYLASCDDNEAISIDYTKPIGDGKGYTSLELLLIALASCTISTLGVMLRGRDIKIARIDGKARGYRRKENPTGFKEILVDVTLYSNDLRKEDVDKVMKIAESTVCPVWCMLKDSVKIEVEYKIETLI